MKNKIWKPLLAPNQQPNLDEINYPLLVSNKIDGIRCILYKGEILSRSLKQIQNKQLRGKLQPLADYTKEYNLILDGEIYSPELTFQEITSFVMTQDFSDAKAIKKHGHIVQIPEHLKFHCFDAIKDDDLDVPFVDRVKLVETVAMLFEDIIYPVQEHLLSSKEEIEKHFELALDNGEEGLILRNPQGRYKCGRGTVKEGIIYKVKLFKTIDAEIIDVIQATKVNPIAKKKINELNRSVTSKKKNDRILIEKAAAFVVKYKGQDVKVSIAMDDITKENIWINKDKYIGRIVEYKFMEAGMKKLPRHPTTVRMRDDKN